MPGAHAQALTNAFYAWERRGRGWEYFPYTVALEPPFRPFVGHTLRTRPVDDGRHATWLSSLLEPHPAQATEEPENDPEPEALPFSWSGGLIESYVLLPGDALATSAAALAWLESLLTVEAPLSFELVGRDRSVEVRIACASGDRDLVTGGLTSFYPEATVAEVGDSLATMWHAARSEHVGLLELGLGREFMVPLAVPDQHAPDVLSPLLSALARLGQGELGVAQVLLEPARKPWAPNVLRAVTTASGAPFFADAPEVTAAAIEKIERPLFAVVIRLGVRTRTRDRSWETLRSLAGGLSRLGSSRANELVPVGGGELEELEADLVQRTSHRSGMLLSSRELASVVHLPGRDVRVPELVRSGVGKAASADALASEGVVLGRNPVAGREAVVRISDRDRLRHMHLVGASGTGKSTLIVALALQDLAAGRGIAVLDPHGDLVDEILGRVPDTRVGDVVVFDPADPEAVVGWNILNADTEPERQMLASDLVGVFRRLSTSWGDQMTSVFANAILAFLDSSQGGTLLDLRQFLVDKGFRESFLPTLGDPHLTSYWTTEFPLLAGKRPQGPILTRLDTLLRSRLVRDVVTTTTKHLDFRKLVDGRKIFLARLSQGAIGQENAALLGSLLVSKFHQVVLSRQDTAAHRRAPFYLYLDEFHELATPSMATMFSGVRKYGLGLVVAHQDLYQLHGSMPEVERAVLANAHTRVCFRVGEEDAKRLAPGFSAFDAASLTGLGLGQAVCRVGTSQDDFNLETSPLEDLPDADTARRRAEVLKRSRAQWGQPRPSQDVAPVPPVAPVVPGDTAPEASFTTPSSEETPPRPAVRKKLPTPGRGGPEHQYLQSLIREWGQARGYKVEIEHELPGGGRVDVLLTKGDARLACEISVSTASGHELGNVRKCLDAGIEEICVVSLKPRFLKEFAERLDHVLSEYEHERVSLTTPESLLARLSGEPVRTETVAGYTVRTAIRHRGAAEQEDRRRRLTDVLAKQLDRLRRRQSK